MELIDVVTRLVGPVNPVGDSHIDLGRQTNLRTLCGLAGDLLDLIERVANMPGDHMASVAKSKKIASEFLAERVAAPGVEGKTNG